MAQYNRICCLTAGVQGEQGIVIESNGKKDSLKIDFVIEKDLTQETNKCNVKITNLSTATAKALEKKDLIVILEVGYAEDIGLRRIFIGAATLVTTQIDASETITSIEMSDGQIPLRDTILSLSYAATSGEKIFTDIAASMGLASYIAPDIEFAQYPMGFSYIGKASPCLDKIASATGAVWSIQNNVLEIILAGGNTEKAALVFDSTSGLIGSPERIVEGVKRPDVEAKRRRKVKKDKHDKKAGWKIKTLLAPTVSPGDLVRVESIITMKGWFRVESLNHTGDTRGNDWYTELELIEIKLD